MKKILGVIILAVGILGFALPILPGWLLVLAGLAILKEKRNMTAA